MRALKRFIIALAVAVGVALTAGVAAAAGDDDEGKIVRIDSDALTITLENGNTYKLSGEFDIEALSEGMEVVLAYDTIAGEKTVTDLITYE